jgi:rRNA maturation endonuclease Nob1
MSLPPDDQGGGVFDLMNDDECPECGSEHIAPLYRFEVDGLEEWEYKCLDCFKTFVIKEKP